MKRQRSYSGPTLTARKVTLSKEQAAALKRICSQENSMFFLTGEAGTGKSEVLRAVIETLSIVPGNMVHVTASTGIAAIEIGGTTLASFSCLGMNGDTTDKDWLEKEAARIVKERKPWHYWKLKHATHLIVDEISMVSAQALDNIDLLLRLVRECSNKPFGGLCVLVVGDFFQLPPVNVIEEETHLPRFEDEYLFAFQGKCWKFQAIVLHEGHRQTDAQYVSMLSRIRRGIVDDEIIAAMQARILPVPTDGQLVTYLFPHNEAADRMNREKLAALPEREMHLYNAVETTTSKQKDPFKDIRAPKVLELKVGAQVMLLKNMRAADLKTLGCVLPPEDAAAKNKVLLANGSVGRVARFEKEYPIVYFPRGKDQAALEVCIQQHRFEKSDGPKKPPSAVRVQLPLMLSYAISIHKAQGCTISSLLATDLGRSFECGQVYVALSRIRSIDQLYLLSFDPERIRAHDAVKDFYASLV